MANALTGNPMRIEGAATIWTADNKYVQLIQWIDDNADITDNDAIVLTINGVIITGKLQGPITNNNLNNIVAWEMSFSPPMRIETFVVTTMSTGNLIIWLA